MPARAEYLVLLAILLAFVAALFELLRAVCRTTLGGRLCPSRSAKVWNPVDGQLLLFVGRV